MGQRIEMMKYCIANAFLQQIIARLAEYDVIAAVNLNGDCLTDVEYVSTSQFGDTIIEQI